MNLSERLMRVAHHVLPRQPMADVGTDHGRLPVWLVLQGVVPSAIAMDLRPAPLSVARRQVAQSGVADRVSCRLSDGLAALRPGEVATVTICGMGGGLMSRILSAQPAVLAQTERLVLQPNTDPAKLRAALQAMSWVIEDEDLLVEGRYVYPVVVAARAAVPVSYSDAEIAFGPILRQRRSPAFVEVLRRQEAHVLRILAQCSGSAAATERFSAELALVRTELNA